MKKNIIISFIVIELLIVLFGVFTIVKMRELSSITQHLYDHPFTVTNATKTIQTQITSMHRYMKDVVLAKNPVEMKSAIAKVNESEKVVYQEFKTVFSNYLGQREDIQSSYDMFVQWKVIRDEVILLMSEGMVKKAVKITKGKGYEHVKHLDLQIVTMVDFAHKKAEAYIKKAAETKDGTIDLIIVVLIALFLLTLFIMITLLGYFKSSEIKHKKHHDALHESEEHFRRLSEMSTVAIYMTDAEGKCTYTNDVWQKYAGMSFEEALGDGWVNAIYEDDKALVHENWKKTIASNGAWGSEYRFIDKEKNITWLYATARSMKDSNGNIIGYVGANIDITRLKEKDKQLLQHTRMAQMGEMISMIAHQWRQPLSAITATTAGIRIKSELGVFDFKEPEDVQVFQKYLDERLEEIDLYVQNLSHTIDDFRNFYKPNKTSVHISLETMILKSLTIIKASLNDEGIEVILELDCDDKIEIYDKEMMHVILNLLKNAQDNFREKEVKNPFIKIIASANTIMVCDNGGGIEENQIDKIFNPYFSTKSEKNGTGLGLYMSKIIIEEHHGGSLVAHNFGEGACFTITIGDVKKK